MFHNQISHYAQSAHACCCNQAVIVWLCVCTGDNPLAKAHGLTTRTYTQTIHDLHMKLIQTMVFRENFMKICLVSLEDTTFEIFQNDSMDAAILNCQLHDQFLKMAKEQQHYYL